MNYYTYDAMEEECEVEDVKKEFTYVDEADALGTDAIFVFSDVLEWEVGESDAMTYDFFTYNNPNKGEI